MNREYKRESDREWKFDFWIYSATTRLSRNCLCDQVFYGSYVLRHIRLRSYCSLNVKTFWETCASREVRRVKLGRPVEERGWGLDTGRVKNMADQSRQWLCYNRYDSQYPVRDSYLEKPMIRQAQTPFLHCVLTAKTNKQQTSKWT